MLIDDGRGKGYTAQVTAENRLAVASLQENSTTHYAHSGQVFTFPTELITYTTTDAWQAVCYIQNTSSDKNLYINSFRFGSSNAANWRVKKNATTGTIFTSGTAKEPVVTKFDSGNSFTGVFKYGANGQTITDGIALGITSPSPGVFMELDGMFIVTPNTTISVEIYPLTNPSQVSCIIIGYSAAQHDH